MLKEDGAFDPASIVQDFKEASTALQEPLRAFVMEILSQYS
ncbi:hypothetical protein [Marispirochaeta sp.]|nr:hypothetical protein [Marispirochaeta sp.]